jgi:hypothetical protein
MEMDEKSRYAEMHLLTVLRQLVEFAHKVLDINITINLESDSTGALTGDIAVDFESVSDAVDKCKQTLENTVARQLHGFNVKIEQSIKAAKSMDAERTKWKELAENMVKGKWDSTEEPPITLEKMARSEQQDKAQTATNWVAQMQYIPKDALVKMDQSLGKMDVMEYSDGFSVSGTGTYFTEPSKKK